MKRLLVIRCSSLGDVVLTTGVIRIFKRLHSDVIIDMLTYKEYKDIFANFPYIDKLLLIDRNLSYFAFLKRLKKATEHYNYIVDLQKNLKTIPLMLLRYSKYYTFNKLSIRRRIFVHLKKGGKYLNTHITERYLQAFNKIRPVHADNLEELRPQISAENCQCVEKRIVIHPFASKKTKEWVHFDELIYKLKEIGYNIAIVGRGECNILNGVKNFTNKTDLGELINEINKASIVISTDSGPMHLAIALNKKVIVIFGSTTKELGFYPYFKKCYVLENNKLRCRPCHVHGRKKCPLNHFQCMQDIKIDMVINLLSTVIH